MNKPARYLFASFFVLILASMIVNGSTDLESITIYHIIALNLLLGGGGFIVYGYHVYGLDGRFSILMFTYLLCMLVLIGVALQQMGPGFPAPGRGAKLGLIALLFLFFVCVCPRQSTYIKRTWPYLLGFTVLLSIYLYHAVPVAPDSGSAGFPISAGFMMGLYVFIIPRYVSRNAFLWTISLLTSVFVLIGIPAYFVGNYVFFGMNVQLGNSTFTPLFGGGQLNVLQSIFVNPNFLGAVGFAGTVAAAMLAVEQFPMRGSGGSRNRDRENPRIRADGSSATVLSFPYMFSLGLSFFAGVLFVINALGTYLSNSRASFLAIGVSLVLYFSYIVLGRRRLPYAVIGLSVAVFLFLALLPVIGISVTGRFALWSGTIEAFLSEPTLLGQGIVSTSEVIAPYVEGPASGHSPHNSYLPLFIRIGLLGGGVYLLTFLGGLFAGAFRYERVDVPALVLTFGFAVHQVFEVYSLFQNGIMAVIASLAFGYLILNGSMINDDTDDEESTDNRDPRNREPRSRRTTRSKSQNKTWSRPEWNR